MPNNVWNFKLPIARLLINSVSALCCSNPVADHDVHLRLEIGSALDSTQKFDQLVCNVRFEENYELCMILKSTTKPSDLVFKVCKFVTISLVS